MRIQHNIMALNSNRQLGINNSAVSKSLEKLSSGFRINRAGDDAAGLAISEKMRAQIKGLEAATDNSQDAISLVQTAEGGLQEVHSMLNRMTELATKSANGTYTDDVDRKALQDEVSALKDEINRIADGTDFNGIKLLDGTMGVGTSGATASATAVGATADKIKNGVDFTLNAPDGIQVIVNLTDGATGATWGGNTLTINLKGTNGTTTYTQADIDKLISDASGSAPGSAKNISLKISGNIESAGTATTTTKLVDMTAAKAKQASGSSVSTGVTLTAKKAGAGINGKKLTFTATAGNAVGGSLLSSGDAALNLETGKSYTASELNKMLSDAGVDMELAFDGTKTTAELTALTDGIGAATAGVIEVTGGAGLSAGGGMKLQIGDTGTSGATASATAVGATADKIKNGVDFTLNAPDGIQVIVNLTDGATGATWGGNTLTINLKGTNGTTTYTQADIDKLISDASGSAPGSAKNISLKISGNIESAGTATTTTKLVDMTAAKAKQASGSSVSTGVTLTAKKAGAGINGKKLTFTATAGNAVGGSLLSSGDAALNLETGKSYTASELNKMLSDAGVDMELAFDGTKTTAELTALTDGIGAATAGVIEVTGGAGLSAGGGMKLQIGDTSDSYNQLELSIADMHVNALDLSSVDISTREGASAAMSKIKTAINTVSTSRGKLGAIQNRLEHTINNLGVTTENITSAESRIRDVDMAKEMMNYTKNSVLVQSAQAMLAQANQHPQSVLQLLQ